MKEDSNESYDLIIVFPSSNPCIQSQRITEPCYFSHPWRSISPLIWLIHRLYGLQVISIHKGRPLCKQGSGWTYKPVITEDFKLFWPAAKEVSCHVIKWVGRLRSFAPQILVWIISVNCYQDEIGSRCNIVHQKCLTL